MIVVASIHGILTGQTSASWPDAFDVWMHRTNPAVHVIKKEYAAGPFPRLNCLWKNWRLARGLAAEMELFADGEERCDFWFFAHSNGAVIALDTMKLLAKRGIRTAGLVLTGAACGSDVEETGVLELVRSAMLNRAVSFSSADDGVVNRGGLIGWLKWPYGDLGRKGWQCNGRPYADFQVRTLWFTGGHSGYFRPGRREETFHMFYRQMEEKG